MEAIMIRQAVIEDIKDLIRLRMALIREANHLIEDKDLKELEENITVYLKENLGKTFFAWVVEEDGQLIASSGLNLFSKPPTYTNLTGKEAFIMNIYVMPAFRGKGYATALVTEIIRHLKGTDCKKVSLVATEAGRFVYEKIGFKIKTDVMEYSL
jgi:predicted GNAT family acetyltransferase